MTEHQLAQKIALVTGAGGGLGEATARRLAAAGACVTCIDLDEERARGTAAAIDASGSRAIAIGCDVGDERAVQTAVERTLRPGTASTSPSIARASTTCWGSTR